MTQNPEDKDNANHFKNIQTQRTSPEGMMQEKLSYFSEEEGGICGSGSEGRKKNTKKIPG